MWIRRLRQEKKLSQDDLAARLQLHGYDIGAGAIGHWENKRRTPPIDNPEFAAALAASLEVDITQMMIVAGYTLDRVEDEIPIRAALIISHLPAEIQKHALEYLQMLERQHGKATV